MDILENEIYKGDFVHGKKTKHPTYYKRTLTYLYLQKLKCPKCGRVLGGKATTKKNGNVYFYYYCNDCKIEFVKKINIIWYTIMHINIFS